MRVAVDARWLQPRPLGGVGRALLGVLPHLRDRVSLDLLTDADWPDPHLAHLPDRTHPLGAPGPAPVWLQGAAPRWLRRNRFDGVFHGVWYAVPRCWAGPTVVTLHDLTFALRSGWHSPSSAAAYRVQARWSARIAGAVLVPSEHVRADVVDTYAVDPARVVVAAHGVDPGFVPDPGPSPVAGPYVVALGGADRRNLPLAVAAWRRAGLGVPLVAVGTDDVPPDVVGLGRPDDATWARVLAGATAFLYPTAYEGYGLPGAEAQAAGTPVVAARVGALPEVLGDAAAWADDLHPAALATALRRAVEDRDELRAAGLRRRAAGPTWASAADAHVAAYTMALS